MHFSNLKSLTLLVLYQTATGAATCGDADACIGTEICTTATFTTPVQTTITTCVPTPTCLGVYAKCDFGSTLGNCCSGYCAATLCRSTDKQWPGCQEDGGPCLITENCCYGNSCVNGICTK
ncbi:hypothetical protein N7488_009599 [Penicillium malachiteum]|nr:hypothetical protein N7488_009599 [Penicillium malachiteum]